MAMGGVGAMLHTLPNAACQSYTWSLWRLPLGNYLLCMAPVAARVPCKTMRMKKYTFFSGHFAGHGMRQYDTVHIAQWKRSRASLEAPLDAAIGQAFAPIASIGHANTVFFS
jgi:hypothetical protein